MRPSSPQSLPDSRYAGPAPVRDRLATRADLLAALGEAVMVTDLEGRIIYWNQAAEELYGWRAEEVLGRDVLEVTPSDMSRAQAEEIMVRLRRGETWSGEFTVQRRDGSSFPIWVTDAPVRDDEGELAAIIGVSRDISVQKESEEALRSEAILLERLHHIAQSVVGTLDLEVLTQEVTDEATRLVGAQFGAFFYNVEGEGGSYLLYALSGAPKSAFADFPMPRNTAVFGPTFRGARVVRSVDITQEPTYGQMGPHFGLPEGHLPVRSYLAVPVWSKQERVWGGLFFGHAKPGRFGDREERVAVALADWAGIGLDNAHLYQAAREANRAKTNFLSVLSHEIRTPLSAILNFSDLLSMEAAGPTTDEQRRYLARMKELAIHLDGTLDTILAWARAEIAGEDAPLSLERVDLAELVAETATFFRPMAANKELAFRVDLPRRAVVLHTDRRKVRQILLNLLSNALKFTHQGQIELVLVGNGKAAKIRVRDTGIGMGEQEMAQLFTPFWQADQSRTRRAEGTGLGLSVSRRLARLLNGDITVVSTPGEGSEFTVTLADVPATP